MYMSFSKTPAFRSLGISPLFGECRRSGMLSVKGWGMLVLQKTGDAEKRYMTGILAELYKVLGTSQDVGFKVRYAPRPAGRDKMAMKRA